MRSYIHKWLLIALLIGAPASTINASTPIDALIERADAIRSSDPHQLADALKELKERQNELNPPQQEQYRFLNSYRMAFSGDFANAISELEFLSKNASSVDIKFKSAAFLANNYALTQRVAESVQMLMEAETLLPYLKATDSRHQGLINFASAYTQLGQYSAAENLTEKILSEQPAPRIRCFAGSLRLEAKYKLGKPPIEDNVVKELIDQCTNANEGVGASAARYYLARNWKEMGREAMATSFIEENMDRIAATRYAPLINGTYALMGTLKLASGDYVAAEKFARRVIESSASNPFAQPVVDAYKALYDIALARGDSALALERYRKYAEADKAYLNDVKAREIAYQLARQQTEQKNQTIALLNQQNEVLRLQQTVTTQEAQNARWRLIIVATLLVLVVGSVVFWGVKVKRLQHSLQRLAETDSLTGVCNRHHFSACAERLLAQAQREGAPIALVIFDLDHFKNINDSHGHPAGDLVLRHATQLCRRHVRDGDLIGRLGGEEFALLLRNCDRHAAAQIAEDCRRHLADLRVRHADTLLRVTASFGVACAGVSGYALKELVAHADKALYAAKRAGRNCVNVHADATAPA